MSSRILILGSLLVLCCVLGAPAMAATNAPVGAGVTSSTMESPPLDAFVLDSPFSSAVPTACRFCISQIGECEDADGTPCGKDAGKDPNDPSVVCRCGFCQGQISCKKII